MTVKVRGYNRFKKKINKLQNLNRNPAYFLVTEGSTLKNGIINRTKSGKDTDMMSFVSYSPDYARYKQKRKGNSSTVTLIFNGKMLPSIQSKQIDNKKFKLYFPDATEKAKALNHQQGRGVPKRKFFGFDKNQRKYMKKVLRKEYRKVIR